MQRGDDASTLHHAPGPLERVAAHGVEHERALRLWPSSPSCPSARRRATRFAHARARLRDRPPARDNRQAGDRAPLVAWLEGAPADGGHRQGPLCTHGASVAARGGPFPPVAARKHVVAAARRVRYDLRHGRATHDLEAGGDLVGVGFGLGHTGKPRRRPSTPTDRSGQRRGSSNCGAVFRRSPLPFRCRFLQVRGIFGVTDGD